jgi:hypothetical protein
LLEFNSERLKGFTVRLAEPEDSPDFACWVAENSQIPQKDLLSATKDKNPTTVVLVVEKNGKRVLFVPVYCQMNIGFLGFNPDASKAEKLLGMEFMEFALCGWAGGHGVNEITVQTAKDYPVARWAIQHDFEPENRQTYKLRVPEVLEPELLEQLREAMACGK